MKERELTAEVAQAISDDSLGSEFANLVAGAIRRFGGYRWVGLYQVDAEEIILLGWDGPAPPAHPRFPRTEGLCGAAVAEERTIVVADVRADPRYLTTHPTTRSEIVVPIVREGLIVGLIDVESERPRAFSESDREDLERCAATIARHWPDQSRSRVQLPGRRRRGA